MLQEGSESEDRAREDGIRCLYKTRGRSSVLFTLVPQWRASFGLHISTILT